MNILHIKDSNSIDFPFLKDPFIINNKDKNQIQRLISSIDGVNGLVIVSDNVAAYYAFYASNFVSSILSTILVDPILFRSNGDLLVPSLSFYGRIRTNKILLLYENNSMNKFTLNFAKEQGLECHIFNDKKLILDYIVEYLDLLEKKSEVVNSTTSQNKELEWLQYDFQTYTNRRYQVAGRNR